jgi:two-component system NtrC family sensor kinase
MSLLTEAEHSNKLASIGRLSAGVAQENNNTLAVIDQKAGLIEDLVDISDDFPQKDRGSRSILGIHDGVQRCKVITHRLLGFARKMDTLMESVQINDILHEVMGFLEKEALHNQIRIDMELAEDLPMIESDLGQLQQIFLNILNNAIDAIGKDGAITLSSKMLDNEHIEVTVVDDGTGMDPDTLKHIFDPFFTTKETGNGTGLGLSITYGLVKRLGGKIHVASEPSVGTCFTLIFPVQRKVITGQVDE